MPRPLGRRRHRWPFSIPRSSLIRLKLSLRRGDAAPIATQFDGTVAGWDVCRSKAADWLAAQLPHLTGSAAPGDDEKRAKALARQELAEIAPWAQTEPELADRLDPALRIRIEQRALRAAHLDPTNEQAAYLSAVFIGALYPPVEGNYLKMSLATMDRAILQTQRYLDRFPRGQEGHLRNMEFRLMVLCDQACAMQHVREEAREIVFSPDPKIYPYLSQGVRGLAESGCLAQHEQYPSNSGFCSFSFNLIDRLIPCIPDDRIDAEYQFWKRFYREKVDPILKAKHPNDFMNTRPVPWSLVEATFAARRKDPAAVRAAFTQLAAEVPMSVKTVWGGDENYDSRLRMYLKAAGDPQWNTWQPTESAPPRIEVGLDAMTFFLGRLAGPPVGAWDVAHALALSATALEIPEAVKKTGLIPHSRIGEVEALFQSGNDLWLITPGTVLNNIREWGSHLFVATIPGDHSGKIAVAPVAVPWPAWHSRNQPQRADRLEFSAGMPDADGSVWMGFRTSYISDNSQWLIAYRPAPPNSRTPAFTDQWVGPFRIPDGGRITRMAAAGNDSLWLTTTQGVYFVDCHGVIAKAIGQGMACSTHQWQKQYAKRLAAADWKSAPIPLLAAKQWKAAGDLLDATFHDSSVSENPREFSVLQLWQAYVAAAKGDFSTAASQYDSTALSADQRADYPEEIFARINQLAVLYDAGRWADLIDLAARVSAKFPQTTPQPGSDLLAQYLATAKCKLAATRPSAPPPPGN